MDKLLALLVFITAIGVAIFAYPAGPLAVLFGSVFTVIVVFLINRNFEGNEKIFLRRLFLIALLLRVGLAAATYVFGWQEFFGGDSNTYDNAGYALYNSWFGYSSEINSYYLSFASRNSGSGFGMAYIVAVIYSVVGRNPLAIQLFNSILGAATTCLIYVCAQNIFKNNRVAKVSAIFVGVFPSLILWSSQGLKDGIICFLLALAMNTLFSIQRKFSYRDIILLLISLSGIYTLRFYIFFAFVVAIFGSFFLGTQKSAASIGKQIVILVMITLGLTYLGVLRNAQTNLDTYGNLERLQLSRLNQAKSAESGFGQDIDVSTPAGAIQVLPLGLAYLMLAPFPWQVTNFRQAITLPELLVWWGMIPFLISGVWYTLKNKLRAAIAVILLTLLLTISYAIFQGNVGTAYRMRAQMQIFYFIFIGVGYTLWKEKRENQMLAAKTRKQRNLQ
ncbi:MAG: glycosyltransferase family 39 protein [Pyrinomonadaceae bacterium]